MVRFRFKYLGVAVLLMPGIAFAFNYTRTPAGTASANPVTFTATGNTPNEDFYADCWDGRYQLVVFESQDTNWGSPGYYFPVRTVSGATTSPFDLSETATLTEGTTYNSVAHFFYTDTDTSVPNCDINILSYEPFTVVSLTAPQIGSGSKTDSSTKFSTGEQVQVSVGPLNVRAWPLLSAETLGVQQFGGLGKVSGESTYGDGLWWWKVDFDSGADGWIVGNYVTKTTFNPPPLVPALPPPPEGSTKFSLGNRIKVLSNIKVRLSPSGQVLGGQKMDTFGTVIGGPIYAAISGKFYWWWRINYDSGPDGWSAEDFFIKSISSPPPLSNKFKVDDRITVSQTVKVRSAPGGDVLGRQKQNAFGKVIGGPTYAPVLGTYYWWWRINYDILPDGWSVEDALTK